jgi:hypothetical protein
MGQWKLLHAMIWSQHGEEIWVFWGSPFVLVNVRIKMNFSAGEYLLSEVERMSDFLSS